jgi:hypothetical protein
MTPSSSDKPEDLLHHGSSSLQGLAELHPLRILDQVLNELEEDMELSADRRQEEVLRCTDFLMGSGVTEGALSVLDNSSCIRKLSSPHRCVFLVRGSTSHQSKNRKSSETYYCQPSPEAAYCSCRSFFERAKADENALCKHLLALRLMPHLKVDCVNEEVSDDDFGTIVMLRVFPDLR